MRIRTFVDEGLGLSSYLVDCADGTAAILDPPRLPFLHLRRHPMLLAARRRRSPCLAGPSVGVYRLLRDAGFVVIVRMYETHPPAPTGGD